MKPDAFAIVLFCFGLIMLFVPMMVIPGIVALFAAFAYWLTIIIVKLAYRRRS